MYKMFFPSGNAEEFCDHVFRTFDMDKNGYIDFKVSSRYCMCSGTFPIQLRIIHRNMYSYSNVKYFHKNYFLEFEKFKFVEVLKNKPIIAHHLRYHVHEQKVA